MTTKPSRKKSRKLLFQELYAMSFNVFEKDLFMESFFDHVFTFDKDDKYITEMVKIIPYYEKFFVNILKEYTPKYNVENMSLSFTLPIYIALAEMFYYSEEIPGKVSINEAVEIAKVYGDDSSKKLVNGVLNKVLNNHKELLQKKDNDFSEITDSCFKN